MGNTKGAITFYEVWVAGNENMEKYGSYSSFKKAKEVAENRRRFSGGTIYVEKVVRERVYDC